MDQQRLWRCGGLQILMRCVRPHRQPWPAWACVLCALLHSASVFAQSVPASELHLQIVLPARNHNAPTPAVVWLKPVGEAHQLPFQAWKRYTLLQKNRMFTPHLLVIPVGSTVDFPNADPFFHNVFSLFDGKRFDLGLYEAGSDKQVVFSREGVSYIFCNIHPEMSAVVVALSTPLYGIADASESVVIHNIPLGEYSLNILVEGVPQATLSGLARRIHVGPGITNLGNITIPVVPTTGHTNKFGGKYDTTTKPPY